MKSHSGKVTARLPEALKGEYRAWIQVHGDRHKYFDRRMGIEQCTAALVNYFMRSLSEAERHSLLDRWLPDVEAQEQADWDRAEEFVDELFGDPVMEELLSKMASPRARGAGVPADEASDPPASQNHDDIRVVPESGKVVDVKPDRKRSNKPK